MLLLFFVLLVAASNLALGFGLAVHFGHGPPEFELSTPARWMHTLRDTIRRRKRAAH